MFLNWISSNVHSGLSGYAKSHPNSWYNVGRWACALLESEKEIDKICDLKREALQYIGKIAFTNINKVRGKNKSGLEYQMVAYSDVAGYLLREEVRLIQPKMVVCCGTEKEFRYHVKDYCGTVIAMPHPGARKGTKKMIQILKESMSLSKGDTYAY